MLRYFGRSKWAQEWFATPLSCSAGGYSPAKACQQYDRKIDSVLGRVGKGQNMKVCIGADSSGYMGKQTVPTVLESRGDQVIDVGTTNEDPVDFPDIAEAVCKEVLSGRGQRGILVCGTGIGACMAANKVAGIRARSRTMCTQPISQWSTTTRMCCV